MRALPSNLPSIRSAQLPELYSRARQELAECARVDECKDWADKAAAMASYAKQSEDESLEKLARKIRARAIRRCGELLREVEPGKTGPPRLGAGADPQPDGAVPDLTRAQQARIDRVLDAYHNDEITRDQSNAKIAGIDPHWSMRSRKNAATSAGMSERQTKQALRVANVPAAEFEAAVESDSPPTIPELAERGKRPAPKPLIDLRGRDPADFRASTQAQGALDTFVEMAEAVQPKVAVRGALDGEKSKLMKQAKKAGAWLARLVDALEETR